MVVNSLTTDAIIKWKGKTFKQVYAAIKRNKTNVPVTKASIMKARPLKIYRKEIVTSSDTSCSQQRFATKIDDLMQPNGYIITKSSNPQGLVAILDAKETIDSVQNPNNCSTTTGPCITIAKNALTRVRTSGIVKPSYNYNYKQLLERRNKTYEQNQFHFNRGNNVFAAQGGELLPCKKLYIPKAITFKYKWITTPLSTWTTVTIPSGYYDTTDINAIFQNTMLSNKHYLIQSNTQSRIFLLSIQYDVASSKVQLISRLYNTTYFNTNTYSFADNGIVNSYTGAIAPQFNISTELGAILGFVPNQSIPTLSSQSGTTPTVVINSTLPVAILPPSFLPVSYKPNNAAFRQQGAQTSSAQTLRVNYNRTSTDTNSHNPNIAFPIKRTPVFTKYSSNMQTCNNYKIR
jgi:hypothetical protein